MREREKQAMAMTSSSTLPLFFKNLLHSPVTATPKPKTRIRTSSMNTPRVDASALFEAAKHTVDTYVKSGMVIGLGSGCACDMAIQYMGEKLRAGALEDIVGIPMSFVSATEAAKAGIPLDQYEDSSKIDFAFHEADIIEQETLIAVIGRRRLQGDDSIIQEKSILKAANKLVFIGTENQYKGSLDGSIPVVVQSLNWLDTAEEIDDLFLGDAEVWRRPSSAGRTDPLGGDFPLLTKEGHNILDVIFTSPIKSLAEVAETLDKIEGVVDHGVISKFPCTAVIASGSEGGLCIVDNMSTSCISVEGL